jgi:hypothetical protein
LNESESKRYVENIIKIWWESAKTFEYNFKYYSPRDFVHFIVKNIEELAKLYKKHEKENLTYDDIKRLINKEIEPLKRENKELKDEISRLRKGQNVQQETRQNVYKNTDSKINDSIPSDRIIEIFNDWARNPRNELPSQFSYADGELRLREKQNIIDGNSHSIWVKNKSGIKKYIFPNPNAIDQIGGDIDAIYTITGTRRARGQNKVIINKPCEIREDGWIDYKGLIGLL